MKFDRTYVNFYMSSATQRRRVKNPSELRDSGKASPRKLRPAFNHENKIGMDCQKVRRQERV